MKYTYIALASLILAACSPPPEPCATQRVYQYCTDERGAYGPKEDGNYIRLGEGDIRFEN